MKHLQEATATAETVPLRRRKGLWTTSTAFVASAALVLTACGNGDSKDSDSKESSTPTAAVSPDSEGMEKFYDQDASWESCGSNECAEVTVPLDYDDAEDTSITLSMVRLKATGKKKGSLLVNPGGPGGSGVQMVAESGSMLFSSNLREHYDIVGFDPRGVGKSTAIECFSDEELDQQMEESRMPQDDDRSVKELNKETKADLVKCQKNTKPEELLSHMTTPASAKDMDVIRAALGEKKLDYLGYSYGTKLGAEYLAEFPGRAGRMVLDGAVDPLLTADDMAMGQAKAFEPSLDRYLEKCVDSDSCWFDGDAKAGRDLLVKKIKEWDDSPLKTQDGRTVSGAAAFEAVLLPMYEPTAYGLLTNALNDAIKNDDGSGLLQLWDLSNDRDEDGSYATNSNEAFYAYNCMDYKMDPVTEKTRKKDQERYSKEAPFFGPALSDSDGCHGWPDAGKTQRTDFDVSKDIPEVLVVGTRHDPATPYAWSERLNKLLPGSSLLTYEGWGHTAYGRSNDCVTDSVDDYLINGSMPKKTTC